MSFGQSAFGVTPFGSISNSVFNETILESGLISDFASSQLSIFTNLLENINCIDSYQVTLEIKSDLTDVVFSTHSEQLTVVSIVSLLESNSIADDYFAQLNYSTILTDIDSTISVESTTRSSDILLSEELVSFSIVSSTRSSDISLSELLVSISLVDGNGVINTSVDDSIFLNEMYETNMITNAEYYDFMGLLSVIRYSSDVLTVNGHINTSSGRTIRAR